MNATIIVHRPEPEDFDREALLPLRTAMGGASVGPDVPESDLYNSADGGYFNAGGIRAAIQKGAAAKRKRKDEKLAIKKIKAQGKANLRSSKGQAKVQKQTAANTQAKAQIKAAEGLAKAGPAIKLPSDKAPSAPKGMSTGAIIGIAVGAAALLGAGIYFIVKANKKKK